MSRLRTARFWAGFVITLLALGGAAAGVYRLRQVQAAGTLPTAPARQGDFSVIVRCRGELKARHSVQIVAPVNVPSLRIVWQAPPGSAVKEGDSVVRFDPSSTEQQLQEKDAALKQAQATLDQAVADSRITSEQDQRDLSTSKYDVEKAKMEASKAEIVSKLQGEESRIDLGLAEQKLNVQEATVNLHATSDRAKIASLTRQRDQAQTEVDLTKHRLSQMELKAPLSGVVMYMQNNSQGWMNAKPFQVGDQVWPGGVVAEIPDLATLEMEGKVEEIDRGRITVGQETRVRIDSLPELTMPADLVAISPLTEQSFEWPPSRSFRAFGHIRQPDPRLRPAMNGNMDVVVSRIPNAISIPAKAVFTRNGKPIVYLAVKGAYRPAEIELLARNPDEVAVKGIRTGDMVALVDASQAEQAGAEAKKGEKK
ncbi:MAG TPA: efflux RND transporter periplasmic adaptor subunit [Bryobacteraceae bacterium]|nr:efflux RND transporter periplasmic adaptor subunit [Bryobacteraceae bacterium]